MKILINNSDLNEALYGVSNLGFVPTMGSLHEGHISLIKRSLKTCNKTIVSIFVNPTQFNNKKDFKKYPRNKQTDLQILNKLKVDFVYTPKEKDIYKSKKNIKIKLNKKDKILCAKYRKGHFEGVIDVMQRLTDLIKPTKTFMGEKDFQQLFLIKKYLKNKHKSKIVSCKTIRDTNKVALSSRNSLLSNKKLNVAGMIAQKMIKFKKKIKQNDNLKRKILNKKNELNKMYDINIEYLELRDKNNLLITNKTKHSKLFIAYYINKVRLIDNF